MFYPEHCHKALSQPVRPSIKISQEVCPFDYALETVRGPLNEFLCVILYWKVFRNLLT
jgi:hypothetical protein